MPEENKNITNVEAKVVADPTQEKARQFSSGFRSPRDGGGYQGQGGGRRNVRRPSSREARPKPEFDQKIINIRRVTRVAAGGKRFNFSVAMVIGNRRGSVGVGLGKGADTALAIDKAMRNAKRHMVTPAVTKTMSIPHFVEAKYSSARLFMQPSRGRGVVAGSAARTVIELAGIKDVTVKLLSPSKNKLNIARAAIMALSKLKIKTKVESKNPTA